MAYESRAGAIPEIPYFRTTHWSVVLRAGREGEAGDSQHALEELCRVYWYPLYSFIRRRGYDVHDAQDLTQAFFEKLLKKNTLAIADRERGRFRTFLLAALNNFLNNEARDAKRLKRGGGAQILSLDMEMAEQQFSHEPSSEASPERIYEQQWVEILMKRVLNQLQAESEAEGQGARFAQLQGYLVGDEAAAPFAEAAARMDVTEAALKGVVRRLRARFRQLLREEIANTVDNQAEIEDEIRHLMTIF